ncbi:hypothetical protein [Legionella sp. PC997]|uniref:hypothetical protein n=1 Tax=Legionella sp. PC997 TaxID=2755562 RepID=UPI0015FD6F07|nr:hypothetical protein [Legionella sp. PC997]QMT60659.1 hypothetical protein HBNCFIEN_02043 [Legionella sp. PC997]
MRTVLKPLKQYKKITKNSCQKNGPLNFMRQYASLLVDDIRGFQSQIKQSEQIQQKSGHVAHPQGGEVNPAQSMKDQMQTLKSQGTPTVTPAVTSQQSTEKTGVTFHVNR